VSAVALGRFLARRMAAAGVDPNGTLTVEDVRARFVPYRSCRGELDLATKAEYDLALLAMLNEPELVEVLDAGLREAVGRELTSPEPGLAVLDGFAACVVGLGPALGGRRRQRAARRPNGTQRPAAAAAAEAEAEAGMESEAPGSEGATEAAACRACGAELPRNREARFCPYCGADQETPRCTACGEELEAEWRYCPACGRAAER
jgi:predicted RNA-binding Zn-ribbon protein involved in translation (DUF1610 family)